MRISFHPNGLKRGFTEEALRYSLLEARLVTRIRERDVDREPSRWGSICFDPTGRALELVAVELADDEVMIIHANYLTAGFEKETREAR
ncbi:hypothetical protein U6G28_07515 [Actinomycetaceae bacterium MB13-C1-2]|nr:hypothetical protein U6G28_07515 [Actinomycetaceae bacterium MB13-C1-2]